MKVIKKGVLPTMVCTCKKCGCVFEIDKTDLDFSVDLDGELINKVQCPTCNSLVKIDFDLDSLEFKKGKENE